MKGLKVTGEIVLPSTPSPLEDRLKSDLERIAQCTRKLTSIDASTEVIPYLVFTNAGDYIKEISVSTEARRQTLCGVKALEVYVDNAFSRETLEEALTKLSGEKFSDHITSFANHGIDPDWFKKILFDVGFNSQDSVEEHMGVIVWHHIQWKKLNS